jgi:hypothetical protein
MTLHSKFDLDVDPGPIDVTYSPSEDMLATIEGIAEHDDLSFRFWAAQTLFVNMTMVTPCGDAEEVVTFIVDDAIEEGEPTDGAYQLILDDAGHIVGVGYDDEVVHEPCECDQLIFEIVRQVDVTARYAGLVQLATLSAVTEENGLAGERLAECRFSLLGR